MQTETRKMNTTSKLYQELKDKKENLLKNLKDKEERLSLQDYEWMNIWINK